MQTTEFRILLPSMRTLFSQYFEPHFLFEFPSFHRQNRNPSLVLHRKSRWNPQNTLFRSLSASCTSNSTACYNGWDDLRIRVDSDELGESNQIRKFLISIGIDDKKYVFTCILGFFCALAISRVRVSSIIVFPAAVIVFAVGFSFGYINGRPHNRLSLNGVKRRPNDDSSRVYVEKLKTILDMFDGFDVKLGELKHDIKKSIDYESVQVGDLEGYVDALESIDGLVLNVRNVVEDCIDSVSSEGQKVQKNGTQKNNRKKKEIGNNRLDLFEYMGNFLRDNISGSKSSKKNVVMRDDMTKDASNPVSTKDSGNLNGRFGQTNAEDRLGDRNQEVERMLNNGKLNSTEAYLSAKNFSDAGGYNDQSVRFMNRRRVSVNMSEYREIRKWASEDHMSSDAEFDISESHFETEASLKHQQILRKSNGAYESSKEEDSNVEDEFISKGYKYKPKDFGRFSSSTVSDDVFFDKCLRKANDLLKQAKECFKNDEILAEEMLRECAKLLSQAIDLKPMSLLAIGQLGNTHLLHGELKLRISRELRSLLSRRDELIPVDETLSRKDRIATLLVNVCEECEALLVEAGRKYRRALSIDGNDVRALYNWGLALFFRAQLVADIGPEVARDADKLFLAAIDKFDAMMSRSNDYAPEALYRWGVALQQRSRLRPGSSRDKVKLLQQAKRLYEDALDMGSDRLQVREALSSCMSELDFSDL